MMSHRMNKKLKKLEVLAIVKEEREILFSKHSSYVTPKDKEAAWSRVLGKAKSLGLVSEERDWIFFRDRVFAVWKARALAKRDSARHAAITGGTPAVLDELDNAILDVVESPILPSLYQQEINGIDGPSTSSVETYFSSSSPVEDRNGEDAKDTIPKEEIKINLDPNTLNNKRSRPVEDERELRKKFLQVGIYKKQLECLMLERALMLPPSR